MNKPTFVAIGPPKTGTTWLYEMLKKHPQVFLPPVKELGYFWEKAFVGDGGLINVINPFANVRKSRRLLIKNGWMKERLTAHRRALWQRKLNLKDLLWDLTYFVLPHTDKWYLGLFDDSKVSGDISPMYALLPDGEIEHLKRLNPDVKIIISLRDPVERHWSRVRMKVKVLTGNDNANKNASANGKLATKLIEDKDESHNISTYDYVELVEKWRRHFPAQNVFVFFYEELLADPQLLLQRICSFLSIEPINIGKAAEERVNKGIDMSLPAEQLQLLIEANLPALQKMPAYFEQPYPLQWLQKYRQILDGNPAPPLPLPATEGSTLPAASTA